MASASAIMDGETRSNILMSGNIFVNVDQCVDGQHHHRHSKIRFIYKHALYVCVQPESYVCK